MPAPIRSLPAALAACALLAGCGPSSKTVSWEEETKLHTGEILWVKRTDHYVRRSEPGNPLQMGWWPMSRRYEFSYAGRAYTYRTDPNQSPGAMLLFPRGGEIVVVDSTKACGTFAFAEFHWDGAAWQARRPGADLAKAGRNLMNAGDEARSWGERITAEDKLVQDTAPHKVRPRMAFDPSLAANCLPPA